MNLLDRALDLPSLLDGALAVAGRAATDPMHQFKIAPLAPIHIGGLNLSFTNSSLFMLAASGVILLFLMMALSKRALVPGRMQSVAELGYGFVNNMVRDALGEEGMKFFPFIFTLFFFILMGNLLGMFPGFFTITSHIIVTLALSMTVIVMVLVVGFSKNGLGFFKLFFPSGLPFVLYFLITPIEIISFLSRPLSLAVRLFANMLAGHMLLKVFAGFVVSLLAASAALKPIAIIPLAAVFAVTGLEFLVAFLQAYVFAVLACIYLNEALHPAH